LLVAVCTAPRHFEKRAAIRRTWASLLPRALSSEVDVLFFIGQVSMADLAKEAQLEKSLAEEQTKHKDIVRLDGVVESYANLTRKTLAIIKWTVKLKYDVMLKVDDDTFVLLDNYFYDIVAYDADRSSAYFGKFWGSDERPVNRVPTSKFFVSREMYPSDFYPNYADGPCYSLGSDLMNWIDVNSASLPLYPMEDAAIGIWLSSSPTLNYHEVYTNSYMYQRVCPEGNSYYFINPLEPWEMDGVMHRYENREDICNGNFTLAVCSDPKKGCLCSPTDKPCWDVQVDASLL